MARNLLTADQVAARLGVKVATVYAYVSRGQLTRTVADDGRTSRFDPAEVDRLAQRGRPRASSRRVGSVNVVLATAITEIADRRLRYRGHDAVELAREATYEAVAELLWTGELGGPQRWEARPEAQRAARAVTGLFPDARDELTDVSERCAAVIALAAASDPLRVDLRPDSVMAQARSLIHVLVTSLPMRQPAFVEREGRRRHLAWQLWPRISPLRPSRPRARVLDAALVLLADHELATSTLAARVAASTRADPANVVLAALGTVSGPLHGKSAVGVHRLLADADRTGEPEAAVARALGSSPHLPGFGHVVYRDGDPRADALLTMLEPLESRRARAAITGVRRGAERVGAGPPNVDFALGALAHVAQAPLGATEAVFVVARTAGWVAHALEEYGEAALRFRARALFTG